MLPFWHLVKTEEGLCLHRLLLSPSSADQQQNSVFRGWGYQVAQYSTNAAKQLSGSCSWWWFYLSSGVLPVLEVHAKVSARTEGTDALLSGRAGGCALGIPAWGISGAQSRLQPAPCHRGRRQAAWLFAFTVHLCSSWHNDKYGWLGWARHFPRWFLFLKYPDFL